MRNLVNGLKYVIVSGNNSVFLEDWPKTAITTVVGSALKRCCRDPSGNEQGMKLGYS